jgi:hypothetical protein
MKESSKPTTSASQHLNLAEHHLCSSQQEYSLHWAAFHLNSCMTALSVSGLLNADQIPRRFADWQADNDGTVAGAICATDLWGLHRYLEFLLTSGYRKRGFYQRAYRDLGIVLLTLLAVGFAYRKYADLPVNLWSREYAVMDIKVEHSEQGFGELQINKTVDKSPVMINGVTYSKALGTHANSTIDVKFAHLGSKFSGACGYPDSVKGGSIYCTVEDKGKILFQSSTLSEENPLQVFSVPASGLTGVTLRVFAATESINFDHAVWVDLKVSHD